QPRLGECLRRAAERFRGRRQQRRARRRGRLGRRRQQQHDLARHEGILASGTRPRERHRRRAPERVSVAERTGLPVGVAGALPSGPLAPAPSRDEYGTQVTRERAGGGLRGSDLVPVAARHAGAMSVALGLALAAAAVALAIVGDPVLAAAAFGAGVVLV